MMITATSARLEELAERALLSRQLTYGDRYQLMLTLLADVISEADLILIDRMLYGIRKGLLSLAD